MSKYLFIGGPKDAEYLDIPNDALYWKFVEMRGITWDDYMNPLTDKPLDILEYIYRKKVLRGDNETHYVFVYNQIPDVMEELLKGYRKGKRRSKKKLY